MTEQITRVLKDIILLCKMSTVFLSIYAWLGKKFDDNWNKNGLGLHIYLNIDPENQNEMNGNQKDFVLYYKLASEVWHKL